MLVPWTDDDATDALDARRGRAARAIFVENRPSGVSANVLPLAMIALQNNIVAWLDVAMVRRELGADRADRPGLGASTRALALAHLLQYRQPSRRRAAQQRRPRLSSRVALRRAAAGRADAPAMIATRDFTQSYFPAEIDTELAPIPDDELPALVEEALALPAIDLTVAPALLNQSPCWCLPRCRAPNGAP